MQASMNAFRPTARNRQSSALRTAPCASAARPRQRDERAGRGRRRSRVNTPASASAPADAQPSERAPRGGSRSSTNVAPLPEKRSANRPSQRQPVDGQQEAQSIPQSPAPAGSGRSHWSPWPAASAAGSSGCWPPRAAPDRRPVPGAPRDRDRGCVRRPELAPRTGVSGPAVSQLLAGLAERGLNPEHAEPPPPPALRRGRALIERSAGQLAITRVTLPSCASGCRRAAARIAQTERCPPARHRSVRGTRCARGHPPHARRPP